MASESLRSRGMAVYALCAIAESEIHDGQLERAAITLNAIRRLCEEITTLANDPFIISAPCALSEASELIAGLETRIQQVETSFSASGRWIQPHGSC